MAAPAAKVIAAMEMEKLKARLIFCIFPSEDVYGPQLVGKIMSWRGGVKRRPPAW